MQTSNPNPLDFLSNSLLLVEAMRKSGGKYDYGQIRDIIFKQFFKMTEEQDERQTKTI